MKFHEHRLILEHQDLMQRLEKMDNFLADEPMAHVSEREFYRMEAQRSAMHVYLFTLGERIDAISE